MFIWSSCLVASYGHSQWTRRLINFRNQLHQRCTVGSGKAGYCDCHRKHSFFSSWHLSLGYAQYWKLWWWWWSQESYHFLSLKIAGQVYWLASPSWTPFQSLTRIHPSLCLLCNCSTPTSFPATISPLKYSCFLLWSTIKLLPNWSFHNPLSLDHNNILKMYGFLLVSDMGKIQSFGL